MSGLQLDKESVSKLMGAAILAHIDGPAKEELIQNAIAKLIEPGKDRYGNNEDNSPLQTAFEVALNQVTVGIIREYLENNTQVTELIQGLFDEALGKLMKDNPEGIAARKAVVNAMVNKMTEAIRIDRWD